MGKNGMDAIAKTGKARARKRRRILIGILFLLLAAPPVQGEEAGSGPGFADVHAAKRRVRLALRIAEAKNRKEARRYYRSLARRQKLAPVCISAPERREKAAGGKSRAGEAFRSGGGTRKRTGPRHRE